MTEDQRRKLEEMASQYAKSTGWVPKLVTDKDYIEDPFMAGAVAGMDVGTRAERERIAMLMEDFASVIPREVVLKMFNPALRIDGTEERES